MKRNVFILTCLGVFLILADLASAGCQDLGGYSQFVISRGNTIILYAGSTPVGQFDLQSCDVQPQSRILLLKSMVCDGDEVLADGNRCTVMDVKALD